MAKRTLTQKKKPKIALPKRTLRRELVDEPSFDEIIENPSDARLIRAFNYYNYAELKERSKTFKEWLVTYAETQDELDVESIKELEEWRVFPSTAALSRMITNGCEFSQSIIDRHHEIINQAIDARARNSKKKEEVKKQVDSPVVRHRDDAIFIEFENHLDTFFGSFEEFSVYDILVKREATAPSAKRIVDQSIRLLEEFELIKKDPEVKEAYAHLTRDQINKHIRLMKTIVADAERYLGNKKAVRKPRKKKEKTADSQVKDLRYMKEFHDLKLVSVEPTTIPGSSSVWLYNTRYKTLRNLVGESLSVRGSTIHGWNPDMSEQKTLRKPEETLEKIISGTAAGARGALKSLKTKAQKPNGRVNEDTIILRTGK